MTSVWQTTPRDLEISSTHVDVWLTSTDPGEEQVQKYKKLLSATEIARADKFVPGHKRREYIITRGVLKQVLSRVTGLDASGLDFSYGDHGKPYLDINRAGKNIAFNVSHSHGMALVAITLGGRLGVDVEKIRPELDWLDLAERYFSASEYQALSKCPNDSSLMSFFTCWTRKEAFVKAVGDGIARGLSEFDVSIDPDESAGLLNIRWQGEDAAEWSIKNIPIHGDYVAALAVDRPDCLVRLWHAPR